MKRIEIQVSPDHPDYQVLEHALNEARRLYNGLAAIGREADAVRQYGHKADKHISKSMGITLRKNKRIPHANNWVKSVSEAYELDLNSKLKQQVARSYQAACHTVIKQRCKGQKASMPGYKCNHGITLNYTKQNISGLQAKTVRESRKLILTGMTVGVLLPEWLPLSRIQSVMVQHHGANLKIIVNYHEEVIPLASQLGPYKAGIDLGVNNLLTVFTDNPLARPVTVNGKPLKSINQWANKESARFQGLIDKHKKNEEWEEVNKYKKKKRQVWAKREDRIIPFMNAVTSQLVEYLVTTGVHEIIIGWNPDFKQNVQLGRKNNQAFSSLPLAYLRDNLKEKCMAVGINVIIREESHTSQASYLDQDLIPVYSKESKTKHVFTGYRESRSWYKRKGHKKRIHADLNAAGNIYYKQYGHTHKLPVWDTPLGLKIDLGGALKKVKHSRGI